MNTITYFEIQSSDLERAAHFYREIFNWEIARDETAPFPYYRITTDSLAGAISGRPAAQPPRHTGTNAFACSIRVADFDATAARILELGGAVALPKFAIAGLAWQGYFTDPDHNVFGIFEEDPTARLDDDDHALLNSYGDRVRSYPGD
jgi:predicted enzyme related to lactoylglutathione lyase